MHYITGPSTYLMLDTSRIAVSKTIHRTNTEFTSVYKAFCNIPKEFDTTRLNVTGIGYDLAVCTEYESILGGRPSEVLVLSDWASRDLYTTLGPYIWGLN